jgi:hypothetical protein
MRHRPLGEGREGLSSRPVLKQGVVYGAKAPALATERRSREEVEEEG